MEIRKIIALLIAMEVTVVCYSQVSKQSREVKREANKVYLLSNGEYYEINEKVVLAKLKEGKKKVKNGIKVLKCHYLGLLEIAVPDSIPVEEYVKVLDKTDDFECVEYNAYAKPCMCANDSLYNNQWGLFDIHADTAWEITTGSPSVKVAVIDYEHIEKNHPDLHYGSDTYSNMCVSQGIDYPSSQPYDHGTKVAGIIAAKTNNGRGIAGIAGGNHSEGSKIIPYCVSQTNEIRNSIYDAVNIGAKIINMSISAPVFDYINQAITYAYNHGVTIVCASGNNNNAYIKYPASHEHTIAVGAVNSSNIRASFSNYGDGLDLVAPGVDIISTAPADSCYYKMDSGTSFSAPHVSGVVALMLSVNPTLTPDQIRDILHNSCTKITGYTYDSNGWNSEVGYGLLNAENAIKGTVIYPMSGPSVICNSTSATYTIDNLPSSYSVSWSINNNNFTITPSGNQCIVAYTGSQGYGMATLTANVYYNSYLIKQYTKSIQIGFPELDELEFYNYYGEGNWIEGNAGNIVTVAGGGSPYYDQYECDIYRLNNNGTETLVKHMCRPTPYFEFGYPWEGWFVVYIRGINDCGYSEWSFGEIECEAPENNGPDNLEDNGCRIVYSPDGNCLFISWTDEAMQRSAVMQKDGKASTYEVQIWNETKKVKSVSSNQQETRVPLAGLPKGFYIAKVIRDGKNCATKFSLW